MAESPSAVPALPGLAVAAVEWLPSGAESGLVRVRGRWTDETAREPELPVLVLLAGEGEHRFDSLPDARFSRDPDSWRGTYLVPAELVAVDPEALWLEWPSGTRSGLPALKRGVEPPPVPAAPERPEEPDQPGGQVIDRAVLAERRAKRAEAAEQAQARVASEALKAVEVLELRSAELERRLEEAQGEAEGPRHALEAALASAADLRAQSREWQLRLRTSEVQRAGDAVRLAVLESERTTGAAALRNALAARTGELEEARERLSAHAADLAAVTDAAAAAQAELGELRRRVDDERAANETLRAELDRANEATRAGAADLESRIAALEAALAAAESRLESTQAELAAAESRLEVETVARTTLEDELDRERTSFEAELAAARESSAADRATFEAELAAARADVDAERAVSADLRTALEAERAARSAAEAEGVSFLARIAELERRAAPENIERLAREQVEAAAAREPAADPVRLVADLDAAAEALRRRTTPTLEEESGDEPPAPDAEPAVDWDDSDETEREPCTPGVEPVRPPAEQEDPAPWTRPGFERADQPEPDEPPAPDAEPGVEWSPPPDPPPAATAPPTVVVASAPAVVVAPAPMVVAGPAPAADPVPPPVAAPEPPAEADIATPEPPSTPPPPEPVAAAPEPAVVVTAPPVAAPPPAVEKPTGPVIVSPSKPPSRAAMVGSDRREYPLLRGAIVKLAHDDAATAARLLAALLPAQGAALEGPLAYDVTIGEAGTYGVAIAGGRASVERLEAPHPRGLAEFHLIADPVMLAEVLAGVDHRIRRFFGPIRARGRKRRLKDLRPLTNGAISVAEAARAGARLDPELVYRVLSYAVHPAWTRGHAFTIAQEITGEPPETWYLTVRDGAGVTVSPTAPEEPKATVTMSREAFDRLLRDEPIPPGRRPCVKGDLEAVAQMRAWTDRARGL